ncbi:MAG: hypothetical protein EOP10_02285 [Proteobacteria bacterium]|nr:MAG: hypothetical protein EOP10_02285 [Pseudomonadota bacterium]
MKYVLSLVLGLAFSPLALAQSAGLDINDVAVLLPLDAQKQVFPNITLAGETPLVLKANLDEVLTAAFTLGIKAPTGTSSITELKDYVITSFRYDPCAPKDHMGPEVSDCLAEVRLIAQPHDTFGPSDTALHLIYQVGDSSPQPGDEVLADLFKIKAKAQELLHMSSSGLPLDVHPLLSAAYKSGNLDVAALYENFIRKHARPDRLKKITMMGLGGQTHWIFFGGNVVDGKWVQDQIPNQSDNTKMAVELDLNSTDVFIPAPLDILVSTFGFFRRELLLDGQITKIRSEVAKIENPSLTNRNNSDCLSCHTATSLHTNSSALVPAFIDGLSATAPLGITAYPAQGLLQRHRLHWNLRAFGYFGNVPTLSMHTVNEAGRSAAQVNEILARVNPGRDCSAVQKDVAICFFKAMPGIGPNGPIDNSAKCMDLCAAAGSALPLLADSTGPLQDLVPANSEVREALYTDPAEGSLLLLKP